MLLDSFVFTMKNPKVAFSVLFKKSNSSSSVKAVVPTLTHLGAQ